VVGTLSVPLVTATTTAPLAPALHCPVATVLMTNHHAIILAIASAILKKFAVLVSPVGLLPLYIAVAKEITRQILSAGRKTDRAVLPTGIAILFVARPLF